MRREALSIRLARQAMLEWPVDECCGSVFLMRYLALKIRFDVVDRCFLIAAHILFIDNSGRVCFGSPPHASRIIDGLSCFA